MAWLRGDHRQGQKLENDGRIRFKYRQTSVTTYESTLKIQRLKRDDLGQYTCTAKNAVGHSWKTVEISGTKENLSFDEVYLGNKVILGTNKYVLKIMHHS